MSFRILLVETDKAAATVADSVLTDAGHRVAWVDSFADAIRQTTVDCPDLMITALRLGPFNGLHLVLRCRASDPDMPAIIVSEPRDLTEDIGRYGARAAQADRTELALLALVSELLAGRHPHDPTSSRRWPRKRAELPATVLAGTARVVELSYGGVRLELARPPGPDGRRSRSSSRPSASPCRPWPAGRSSPKKAARGAAAPKSRPWTRTRPAPGAGSSTL